VGVAAALWDKAATGGSDGAGIAASGHDNSRPARLADARRHDQRGLKRIFGLQNREARQRFRVIRLVRFYRFYEIQTERNHGQPPLFAMSSKS